MPLQIIPEFKQGGNKDILKMIADLGREKDVDCMKLTGICQTSGKMPVYVFVTKEEVVIVMMDWQPKPDDELADEEEFMGQKPLYFTQKSHRVSPVWQLSELTRQYKQAMIDSGVVLNDVWSVLITNSNIINYDDMMSVWEMANVTVYHHFRNRCVPFVYHSCRYRRALALPQYKAFRQWCEAHGHIPRDPYAFEDIDADYDEMEFGPDDDEDDDIEDTSFDDDELLDDMDCLIKEKEWELPDIDITDYPAGSVRLSQNNVVNVEILKPMPSPREELEKMVGCQNIKSQISDLLELTKYNQWMLSHYPSWKQHHVSLHAIFLGRPGTGKTTVCKIYGGLLKAAGVLSKGHVVVCNRSTFMGSNWGDEEKAIRQVLDMAKGGVLMIDEAYLLNSSHPNDPGKLILPQFMDILSNEQQRDLAIVLCGYKDQMQKLLDLNPGLASRFSNHFEFKDFSVDELMEITLRRLKEYGYHFTRAGLHKYKTVLTEAYAVRNPNNWGNARFVVNLLERIYLLHAKRCMKSMPTGNIKSFFSITPSDIQPIDVPKDRKHIGF